MSRNPKQQERVEQARTAVIKQLLWIEEHGGTTEGYVRRYGDSNGPQSEVKGDGGRLGDGGQRIYEADVTELRKRQEQLDRALGGRQVSDQYLLARR